MSCSTCHVIIDNEQDYIRLLNNKSKSVEEVEMDMLDLAWGYTENKSRLGCNIKVTEHRSNPLAITVPSQANDCWN